MNTKRVILANVLSIAVLASYGCSDDAANGTFLPKVDSNACTQEGEKICDGDDARKVCREGSYQKEACSAGQGCKGGECIDKCDISSFVPSCDGTGARFLCEGGFVSSVSCGQGELCNGGNCEKIPVVETCDEATFKASCIERTVQKVCDGGKVKEIACDLGSVCVDGECGEPCTESYSQRCDGNTAVSKCRIGSDGVSGIVVTENCTDGVCEDNECVVKTSCDETAFKPVCDNESSVTSCGSDHFQKVDPCPVGNTCEGGICQSFEESCQPNEVRCVSAQIAERCVEGKFHQYYCNVGEELCSSGTCVPESSVEKCLLDDAPYCKNGKLVKCEYGVEVSHSCADDMFCAGGNCVQCDPASFVQKCEDDKEVRCNANGTLVRTECPDGYACGSSSNACTKSCDATHPCEAPYTCDSASKECVFVPECDVASFKATCDGNSVKSCEAPGSFKTEACSAGLSCLDGKCVECNPATYIKSCDGNAPTKCSEDGKIVKEAACTGAKGVCYEGKCVACTPETAEHSCKDSRTELTCLNNEYIWNECVTAENEICVANKGCVSKCGDDFKRHCDASGNRVVCGDDGNPVVKSCEADEVCREGRCESIIGNPCNYYTYNKSCVEINGYVYLLYCDEGDAGIQRKYCSTIGTSNSRFCGTMNGSDVGCYDTCNTLNSITCLTYTNSASIGMCKQGTDYLGNPQNGFSPETSICETDYTAVSCHKNAENHATFDYLICDVMGGGTCSNAQKTCTSLPSCSAKGGQCSSNTAINCVFDPAQNSGTGGLVKTTQKCVDGVSCKTYVDDGVTYAICNESAQFDLNGDGVKVTVSTLGTCIDKGTYKMLSRAYRNSDGSLTARTIRCHKDCVTNADGFSYCK